MILPNDQRIRLLAVAGAKRPLIIQDVPLKEVKEERRKLSKPMLQ